MKLDKYEKVLFKISRKFFIESFTLADYSGNKKTQNKLYSMSPHHPGYSYRFKALIKKVASVFWCQLKKKLCETQLQFLIAKSRKLHCFFHNANALFYTSILVHKGFSLSFIRVDGYPECGHHEQLRLLCNCSSVIALCGVIIIW